MAFTILQFFIIGSLTVISLWRTVRYYSPNRCDKILHRLAKYQLFTGLVQQLKSRNANGACGDCNACNKPSTPLQNQDVLHFIEIRE